MPIKSRALALVGSLLLMGLLLSGCVTLSDPESFQEYRADRAAIVQTDQSVGQTLVSRRPRLNGIQIWLRLPSDTPPTGALTVELYHTPQDTTPLVVRSISYGLIASNASITVDLPPQSDPPGQRYYIQLKTASGPIEVFGRLEDAYPDGEAYLNQKPQDADLSFHLTYDYDLAALLVDLNSAASSAGLIVPLLCVLWLPGAVILNLFRVERFFDEAEQALLAAGLSLAFIPVLMTWTTALGLHWSRTSTWIGAIFLTLLLAWRNRQGLSSFLKVGAWRQISPAFVALGAIFVISLAVRLIMVRDQAAPLWVDSIHHAMITRLIVEHGGFPASYAPYLDIETANYHSGFHSLTAAFHWLSDLPIPDAMLLLGQALNALVAAAAYLFTTTLVKNRPAGIAAALVSSLCTPMPAYYASWGRYTQLASLLVLPTALALILKLWDQSSVLPAEQASEPGQPVRRPIRMAALGALACAGLFLTHYRVIAFLAGLLVIAFIPQAWRALRARSFRKDITRQIGLTLAVALLAIGLTLPWWPATLTTLLIPKLEWTQGALLLSDFSWGFLTSALGQYSLALAGAGLLAGLFQRRSYPLVLALWVAYMFFLANLGFFHLPGSGFINNLSVEITLFLPISALAGAMVGWLYTAWNGVLPERWRLSYHILVAALGITVAIIGARTMLPILNPVTMLIRQADRPAMQWIAEHLPDDAAIAINPFFWGYGVYAGNDGGFWITPIAGRRTLPPPILYSLGNDAERIRQITDGARQILDEGQQPEKLAAHLDASGIRYVYIGVRGGALSPQALLNSKLFHSIYRKDGVWIFERIPNNP